MPIKHSCFIHGDYQGETCPQCENAPPSVPVESIVGFCAWAWDKGEDRWLTRCGYQFKRRADNCDTGEFFPFPFCPYCGERITKPNTRIADTGGY